MLEGDSIERSLLPVERTSVHLHFCRRRNNGVGTLLLLRVITKEIHCCCYSSPSSSMVVPTVVSGISISSQVFANFRFAIIVTNPDKTNIGIFQTKIGMIVCSTERERYGSTVEIHWLPN